MAQPKSMDFCNGIYNFTSFEEKVATFSAIPLIFVLLVIFCLSNLHHTAILGGWLTAVAYLVLVGYYPLFLDPNILKDTIYITHILWNVLFISIYFFAIYISDKKTNMSVNNTGFTVVCISLICMIGFLEYWFRNECNNLEWTLVQLTTFILVPLSRFLTILCTTKNVRSQNTKNENYNGKSEKLLTEIEE